MKGSPVSPFIFSAILALLSPPALNRAGAATPAEIQPRAPAPGRPLNTPAPAGFIVQSVPVNHRAAAEMKNLLAALVTPGGSVAEEPGGKTLMITDTPANIQNVLEIKELTDAPAFAARLDIFTPKKASADELAGAMAELTQSYLFSVRRDEAAPVELIPFPQGNRILAVGRSENAWNLVRPWLERGWCRSFVINLKFGRVDAVKLLRELRAVDSPFAGRPTPVIVRRLYHDREEFTVVG